MSAIYILYSLCTSFRDSELRTGDCNGVHETFVGNVTRKIPYWLSDRFCGGGKTEGKKLVTDKKVKRGGSR
jgi:hypothetical protein